MKILYLSGLASKAAIDDARQRYSQFSGYAAQKFNRLVAEGLARNGHSVLSLSSFYLPKVGHSYHRKSETEDGVRYRYITTLNIGLIRHLWLTVYCFVYVFFWGLFWKKNKIFMADILNISACMGAMAAARIVNLKRVGIVTDMPGMRVSRGKKEKPEDNKQRDSFNTRMNKGFLDHFTHYVFLTEAMNEVLNPHNRPYIVMEGLVDGDIKVDNHNEKNDKRVVIYAGGLHERYGLRLLVEGFMKANVEDSELWLYGNGSFTDEIPEYHQRDFRIIYMGIKPNDEVIEAELKATLLVNPRPTHEEFTKYSFPSKNLEYMVSGTPLLTTKLPGMPEEYYPYVFLFDDETTDGYADTIRRVLTRPKDELRDKGSIAKQWILTNKNNVRQTERIVELINKH